MTPAHASDLLGRRILVTCDNYFLAPDGRQYRGVYGTLVAVQTSEESLGVKVSLRSQDWYLTVGRMRIAGCQIHYAILTDECHAGPSQDYTTSPDKGVLVFERPSAIYFADPR